MKQEKRVLWTGGWDSTFRMVELSFEDVDIFPVYVLDPGRHSKEIELQRMNHIIDVLKRKPLTKARIHEIEVIRLEDIPEDPQITQAYNIIHSQTNLGSQHEWLARLGKQMPGLEMGTEAGEPETSHIIHAIRDFGELVVEDGIGHLDPTNSSKEGMLVLGWFGYPIITRTEQDMLRQIRQWGYEDVMENIWFCHMPISGKPCGCCHPCEVKMESDMAFLLPKKAQMRYKIYKSVNRCFGKGAGYRAKKVLRKLI